MLSLQLWLKELKNIGRIGANLCWVTEKCLWLFFNLTVFLVTRLPVSEKQLCEALADTVAFDSRFDIFVTRN